MTAFQMTNNFAATSNGPGTVGINWPGGDGWIIVQSGATFTGAAKMDLAIQISSALGGSVPTSTINASGVYPFSAPAGTLQAGFDDGGGGTVSNLFMFAVTIP